MRCINVSSKTTLHNATYQPTIPRIGLSLRQTNPQGFSLSESQNSHAITRCDFMTEVPAPIMLGSQMKEKGCLDHHHSATIGVTSQASHPFDLADMG